MKTLAVPIAAVGAAIASLGTAAVLAADNINKAYNAIRVGSGATGEDLEALKSDFDAVFGTIPAGAGEVGTAIADLNTRLGLTGKPLQNMATRFLELSRITGTDVALEHQRGYPALWQLECRRRRTDGDARLPIQGLAVDRDRSRQTLYVDHAIRVDAPRVGI